MSDTIQPNGAVVASSQLGWDEHHQDEKVYGAMRGIVLAVHPSDDPNNFSAESQESKRGHRHEATVLIVEDGFSEPNLILENVVIPPESPSGIDDFAERLPRAVSRSLTQSDLTEQLSQIDYAELDGDRCVVQFVGGNLDKPFITNWWHHERNTFEPATSEQGIENSPSNTLKQADPKKNKFRHIKRLNGVLTLVTKEGDVYLDTSEANSTTETEPVPKRVLSDKGGSVQVNVKTGKQLEFNWNPTVEGLAAGSTSQDQTRENDLPHLNQDKSLGNEPKARDKDQTIVRFKAQEGTVSTGKLVLYIHKDGDGDGVLMMTGEETVVLGQGPAGSDLASLIISNGELLLSTPGGDSIAIQDGKVTATESGGASVMLQGGAATVIAPSGVSLGTAAPVDFAVLGTLFMTTYLPMLEKLNAVLLAGQATISSWKAQVVDNGTPLTETQLPALWNAIIEQLDLLWPLATAHSALALPPANVPAASPWLSKTVSAAK
jgi:hypothetical protein